MQRRRGLSQLLCRHSLMSVDVVTCCAAPGIATHHAGERVVTLVSSDRRLVEVVGTRLGAMRRRLGMALNLSRRGTGHQGGVQPDTGTVTVTRRSVHCLVLVAAACLTAVMLYRLYHVAPDESAATRNGATRLSSPTAPTQRTAPPALRASANRQQPPAAPLPLERDTLPPFAAPGSPLPLHPGVGRTPLSPASATPAPRPFDDPVVAPPMPPPQGAALAVTGHRPGQPWTGGADAGNRLEPIPPPVTVPADKPDADRVESSGYRGGDAAVVPPDEPLSAGAADVIVRFARHRHSVATVRVGERRAPATAVNYALCSSRIASGRDAVPGLNDVRHLFSVDGLAAAPAPSSGPQQSTLDCASAGVAVESGDLARLPDTDVLYLDARRRLANDAAARSAVLDVAELQATLDAAHEHVLWYIVVVSDAADDRQLEAVMQSFTGRFRHGPVDARAGYMGGFDAGWHVLHSVKKRGASADTGTTVTALATRAVWPHSGRSGSSSDEHFVLATFSGPESRGGAVPDLPVTAPRNGVYAVRVSDEVHQGRGAEFTGKPLWHIPDDCVEQVLSTPELRVHVERNDKVVSVVAERLRIVDGPYLEPDADTGRMALEVVADSNVWGYVYLGRFCGMNVDTFVVSQYTTLDVPPRHTSIVLPIVETLNDVGVNTVMLPSHFFASLPVLHMTTHFDMRRRPRRYVALQLEYSETELVNPPVLGYVLNATAVVDYSAHSYGFLKQLRTGLEDRLARFQICHHPVLEYAVMVDPGMRHALVAGHRGSRECLFVGSHGAGRRVDILKAVGCDKANDLAGVDLFKNYAVSAVNLNIHAYDTGVLELARLVPMLSNKVFVVSETGDDPGVDATLRDAIVFADTQALPQTVADYARDDRAEARAAIAQTAYGTMRANFSCTVHLHDTLRLMRRLSLFPHWSQAHAELAAWAESA